MKKLQKLFAVIMIMVLALSMAVSVSAEGENNGKITVTSAVEGQVYTLYQIATLESSTAINYSYKITDDKWEAFLEQDPYNVEVTNGYIRYDGQSIANSELPGFALAAIEYAKANGISAAASLTADSDSVVFENLALGYYAIDSTLGTVCILTTANPEISIGEKNSTTTINKFVKEDSNGTYDKSNDATIGQEVEFLIEVDVTMGAINYIIKDEMSDGLTMGTISSVTYILNEAENHVDYEIVYATEGADAVTAALNGFFGEGNYEAEKFANADFVMKLDNADLVPGTQIEIKYTATVNENAIIAESGNPNDATLYYGENPYVESEKTTTTTFVWDFSVFKYAAATGEEIPLAGAVFQIYDSHDNVKHTISFVDEGTDATTGYPVYRVVMNPVEGDGSFTDITTNADGKFHIRGLDSGVYYLTEIAAPAGYNPLTHDVTVNVMRTGSLSQTASLNYTVANAVDGYIKVLNNTGYVLPGTGGIGTVLFIAIGGILVVATGMLMVVKKRMSKVTFVK